MPIEFKDHFKKAQSEVFITLAEKLIPPVKLEVRQGNISLNSALYQDSHRGNYYESACQYFTVLENSKDQKESIEAVFGLTQQLINLGRLGQAKKYLEKIVSFVAQEDIADDRFINYSLARVNEKLGWIADYEGNYRKEASKFNLARDLINSIPEDEQTKEEKQIYSTSTHYLGRAYFGLGNYDWAIGYFEEHLEGDNLNPDEKGYGHGWLARCYMEKGNSKSAAEELISSRNYFEEYLKNHPERGTMAHWFMLNGERFLKNLNFEEARDQFELALSIHLSKERYPAGESRAMFAIAFTYWAERNIGAAFTYALKGFLTYPLSVIKPSL